MNKKITVWLIVAAALFLVGCIMIGGAMSLMKWDFGKLSTSQYDTYEYTIEEAFSGILVSADTADITFTPSEDGLCRVVLYEAENRKSTVTVTEGKLTVSATDSRKWYQYIGIGVENPEVTVYLPEGEYASLSVKSHTGKLTVAKGLAFGELEVTQTTGAIFCYASAERMKLKASTGNITVKGVTVDSADLTVSTGKVTVTDLIASGALSVKVTTGNAVLTDTTCGSFLSTGSTGKLEMKNLAATESLSVTRDTGDVIFERCDAPDITVETDTGDVKGSLLTGKIFTVDTDTGRKSYPNSTDGGKCKITTDTGDIKITVVGE